VGLTTAHHTQAPNNLTVPAANNALYIVVLSRLRYDHRTRHYKKNLSESEIIPLHQALRCPRDLRRPATDCQGAKIPRSSRLTIL
jgi:hypothetical protein